MEYKVYLHRETPSVYVVWKDRFGFEQNVANYLAEKSNLTNTDYILRSVILQHQIVLKKDFKKLRQALRHYDEIGFCNEIVELVEELEGDASVRGISMQRADGTVADYADLEI